MENLKLPYLPEETLRIQRVEVYLQDLKDRLKDLRIRHDEVINNSVDIIKEINEVSSSLLLTQGGNAAADTSEKRKMKIKNIILEFETSQVQCSNKVPVVMENRVDIRKILQNFERLNDSQLLKDSIMLFRQAKESFDKIDNLLGDIADSNSNDFRNLNISIRDKIEMLNKNQLQKEPESSNVRQTDYLANVCQNFQGTKSNSAEVAVPHEKNLDKPATDAKDTISIYASCCSSVASFQRYRTVDNKINICVRKDLSLSGYEGDNDDSEFDIFSVKKSNNLN